MDARCHIELFGELRVIQEGRAHTRFRTHKAALLLAYLALRIEQAQPRERLIELFWPDMTPESGRDNLSTALSQLRRQLEPIGVLNGSVLIADRQQARLNAEGVSVDVGAFDRLVRQARQRENGKEKALLLEQAVNLYRGDLLPGCYEEWALREQARYQNVYVESAAQLVPFLEANERFTEALSLAQRITALNPFAEEGYQAQMRLLVRMKRSGAALQVYAALEQLFLREMGARPSAAMQQMAETIRCGPTAVTPLQAVSSADACLPAVDEKMAVVSVTPAPSSALTTAAAPLLPLQLTRFFGREREREELLQLLQTPGARLVSLLGPGGVGKTRFAVEVAGQIGAAFANRVWFVSFADIPDTRLIASVLVNALRLPMDAGRDPLERVIGYLGDAPCLLVLDNLEHLLYDAPEAGKNDNPAQSGCVGVIRLLLQRAPGLVCLVTSRQALRMGGEYEFPLTPLALPPETEIVSETISMTVSETVSAPVFETASEFAFELASMKSVLTEPVLTEPVSLESLLANAGIALYVDRARAARPDFALTSQNAPAVAALCRRLEGMPLAIEMAAAWARTLSPHKMLERLEHQLDLLVSRRRDLPMRHQSMRAAIEWSCALLSEELRQAFIQLSVFRGGWTLEAAEAVCGKAVLHALIALQEHSLVVAVEIDGHARYRMLEPLREFGVEKLVASGEREMIMRRHAAWCRELAAQTYKSCHTEAEKSWMDAVQRDIDNTRSALQFCLHAQAAAQDRMTGADMIRSLVWFWMTRGYVREGRQWVELALTLASPETIRQFQLFTTAAILAHVQNDLPVARALFEAGMRQAVESRNLISVLVAQNNLAIVLYDMGEVEQARSYWEEVAAQAQVHAQDNFAASALCNLGELAYDAEDDSRAIEYMEACMIARRRVGDLRYLGRDLMLIGKIACRQGKIERARAYLYEGLRLRHEVSDAIGMIEGLEAMSPLALLESQPERAARMLACADHLRKKTGTPRPPNEERQFAAAVAAVRAAVSGRDYEQAWAAGGIMTLEQAMDYALASAQYSCAA